MHLSLGNEGPETAYGLTHDIKRWKAPTEYVFHPAGAADVRIDPDDLSTLTPDQLAARKGNVPANDPVVRKTLENVGMMCKNEDQARLVCLLLTQASLMLFGIYGMSMGLGSMTGHAYTFEVGPANDEHVRVTIKTTGDDPLDARMQVLVRADGSYEIENFYMADRFVSDYEEAARTLNFGVPLKDCNVSGVKDAIRRRIEFVSKESGAAVPPEMQHQIAQEELLSFMQRKHLLLERLDVLCSEGRSAEKSALRRLILNNDLSPESLSDLWVMRSHLNKLIDLLKPSELKISEDIRALQSITALNVMVQAIDKGQAHIPQGALIEPRERIGDDAREFVDRALGSGIAAAGVPKEQLATDLYSLLTSTRAKEVIGSYKRSEERPEPPGLPDFMRILTIGVRRVLGKEEETISRDMAMTNIGDAREQIGGTSAKVAASSGQAAGSEAATSSAAGSGQDEKK
jgi:hypothetical protein